MLLIEAFEMDSNLGNSSVAVFDMRDLLLESRSMRICEFSMLFYFALENSLLEA